MQRVLEEWPEVKAPRLAEILREHGYRGSVDLVERRLRELRPPAERPARRSGFRPPAGLAAGLGATRPKIGGRERRVYAPVRSLPHSGAHRRTSRSS
jgi:hypothetical protein